jgi:para-nitrobenzyl esterase
MNTAISFIKCLALISVAFLTSCIGEKKSDISELTIEAGGETLRGLKLNNGIYGFLGVPFAAAPIGPLRWQAAQPVIPRIGIQSADSYGPACPQSQGNPDWYRMVVEGFGGDPAVIPDLENISEDCLYLNVWTPNLDANAKLPIVLWIHGGSNVNGWAYEPNYVGDRLAAKGAVVMSTHYRMGSLGFLPEPFGDGSNGNFALTDLITTIKWARENAYAFGGNPDNITLVGESSGAGNIFALMKSPKTVGLFQRVILQSGALGPADSLPLETVRELTRKMYQASGIESIEQARDLPWQEFVDLNKKTGISHYHGPVIDDNYVRRDGQINPGIDVLGGSNLNEMLMYLDGDEPKLIDNMLAAYPKDKHPLILSALETLGGTDLEKADRLSTASEFHCPAVFIARAAKNNDQNAYVYRFTRKRERAERYGAYHGAEIPYVFNKHDEWLPTDETDEALTDIMMGYWINFATSGNPNGGDLPKWSANNIRDKSVQELGSHVKDVADIDAHLCQYLDEAKIQQ